MKSLYLNSPSENTLRVLICSSLVENHEVFSLSKVSNVHWKIMKTQLPRFVILMRKMLLNTKMIP